MHILLTNDDGIYAEGIYAIYKELVKVAKVTVVAPDSERSSVGHGITLAHPIWQKKISRKGKFFGIGVSGTPADCVKFACHVLLERKPDLIISGINLGPNEGCSVFYSGTVAGAREGALLGIPSMAVSLGTFINADYRYAAKCTVQIARACFKTKMPRRTFLNINVPAVKPSQIKGIRITQQGTDPIHSSFSKRRDPNLKNYYWLTGKVPVHKNNNRIDTYALNNHYVTVTPIASDSTDYTFLPQLDQWKF